MPRPYSDYLKVNKDFVPVFNRYEDKKYPEYWKSFYPHDTFIKILGDLVGSLEGTTAENRRPLWIYGAYGTGKTFASFTLKHIIEEKDEDVRSYFEKYTISESLRKRLEGVKCQGDILVVHRASSSGIIGDNSLFTAVQETVKQALKEKGYTYFGGKTLYDNVLDRIKDPDDAFNFRGAFRKYKSKFTEYDDVESIIADLEDLGSDKTIELLTRIIEVGDLSGFNFAKTADDVVMWLEDIIKENNLYSIVFIWDEFTEYFLKNPNSTSGLQELTHASGKIPFYFLLITHKTHEQFIYDTDTRKKLEARFKMRKLEMADTTAFMLMRNAIDIDPDLNEEWTNIKSNLWFKVEKTVKNTINRYSEDIKNEDLKGLLPMHPFAALLLQDISSKISSNQRTMFQFLCGNPDLTDTTKHNFRWFISDHDVNNWPYLTSDYIWDYFDLDNVDLDDKSKNAISHYHNFAGQCQDENEERVLKVTLLLTAIQRERGRGITNLLRPTLSNISAAFAGTPIADQIVDIMHKFVKKGVFGSMPEGNDTLYVTQSQSIDEETFKELENKLKGILSFEKLIVDSNYSIAENFVLTGYALSRFEVICASHRDLKTKLAGVKNIDSNKVPLVFMFAKNEEDSVKNYAAIQTALAEQQREIIIADISSQPLTDLEYDNFIKCKVKSSYFIKIDPNQARLNESQAKAVIDTWKTKINNTTVKLYSQSIEPIFLIGAGQFSQRLKEINAKIYPYGLESITSNDKMFSPSGYRETVPAMGMDKIAIPANFNYLQIFKNNMAKDNIWNNKSYYNELPAHTLSKMKLAVEKLISESFALKSSIAIIDIWNLLKEKPFGLMSCIGSAFVMGFLLKEYADSGYYKKDANNNNAPLTHNNLADMIVGVIKGLKHADNQYIVKMTEEHELFCKYSGEIFKLSSEKQNSIQDIMKGIKTALPNTDYPLWALKYYIKKNDDLGLAEEAMPVIDLYCEFVSINKQPGRDETKIAEEIVRLFKRDAGIKDYLKNVFNGNNLKAGMDYYISDYKPELVSLAERLGAGKEYIGEIKNKLTADSSWLWEKGDIDNRIEEVFLDYKIVEAVNKILFQPVSKLDSAAEAIRSRLSAIKMPFEFFKGYYPELDKLFMDLINIYKTSSFKGINKTAFLKELEDKADLFNNFYAKQQRVFKTGINDLLKTELTDEEATYLYGQAESKAILKPLYDYEQDLKQTLTSYQKNKKYEGLLEKWKSVSDTNSPAEWSFINKIPILCLFGSEIQEAKQVFDIINAGRAKTTDLAIEQAITFLDTNLNINLLNDKEKCNQIFKGFVSGEYDLLITDIDEIKNLLYEHLGSNVYDWFIHKNSIESIVKEYATKKYITSYYNKVYEKIDKLPPEQVKTYLKELIKDEPLVGIKIMKS
ncbi:MAG: hypothetical protein QHH75_13650 [Bacillota bacterium]|nr:hypothetical protein [Bacillota bacterium]